LSQSEPLPYTRTRERPAPVLGSFQPIIDQILADDQHAPPSSGTPPCRSSAASGTSTATPARTDPSNATCSSIGGAARQLTDQEVLRLAGHKPGDRVEATDLDDIFRDAVAGDNAKKFQKLIQALKDTLDDIRVYRVGEVEKDVYIVGKTKGGGWAGLKSKVVET
jgi:hypothetical protein